MDKKKIENELISSINNHDEITRETILKAQGINFKDIPEEVIQYDDYGFENKENSKTSTKK